MTRVTSESTQKLARDSRYISGRPGSLLLNTELHNLAVGSVKNKVGTTQHTASESFATRSLGRRLLASSTRTRSGKVLDRPSFRSSGECFRLGNWHTRSAGPAASLCRPLCVRDGLCLLGGVPVGHWHTLGAGGQEQTTGHPAVLPAPLATRSAAHEGCAGTQDGWPSGAGVEPGNCGWKRARPGHRRSCASCQRRMAEGLSWATPPGGHLPRGHLSRGGLHCHWGGLSEAPRSSELSEGKAHRHSSLDTERRWRLKAPGRETGGQGSLL